MSSMFVDDGTKVNFCTATNLNRLISVVLQPIDSDFNNVFEETGYESNDWLSAGRFSSSAGLTDETTFLFIARQCYQTGPGGGVGRESLRIHEIPRVEAASWLQARVKSGQLMDAKIWAALWFLDQNG